MKIAGIVVLALILVVAILLLAASSRWSTRSASTVAAMSAGETAPDRATFSASQVTDLPAPVRRYLLAVIPEGHPIPRHARLEQTGEMLVKAEAGKWGPFTATQDIRPEPAAFLWDARISMAGLPVRVRDSFLAGRGGMYGAALGLVTVVRMEGTPAIATAALQRWLAEAPWLPTALLPSASVSWTPLDDSTARATVTSGGVSASVDFHFGADSLISRVTALRGRADGKTSVPTPWEGRWLEYGVRGGFRIPVVGEVSWILPAGAGRQVYWRGRVTRMEYR